MKEYRLFYSWQNDRKDTKRIIMSALRVAAETLRKYDIALIVDQDTRGRTGKRNIDAEVLEKIRGCDIFLADLTPVITYYPPKDDHELPKLMPNSNVMYEYGYALHAKGENRMIVLASLNKEEDEHIEFMPFDINHDTITLFSDEKSLINIHVWIRKIIEDVDRARATIVPDYACKLLFYTGEGLCEEATIQPKYKKIYYTVHAMTHEAPAKAGPKAGLAELVSDPLNLQKALMNRLNAMPERNITVKPIKKTTKLSYAPIKLVFVNQGNQALDNLHISILSSDDRVTFANTNEESKWGSPTIFRNTDTMAGDYGIVQKIVTLNPGESEFFDQVYIHAPHDIGAFKLCWRLSSRSYRDSGELTVHVKPEYEYDTVENDKLAGTERVVDLEFSE